MLLEIVLLIILIFINGIFSATEIAFLSINKYELNKESVKNNKKAIKIINLINDSSTFLSAIQIAITLSSFLASAFAAENFASEIANLINISFLTEEATTNILIIIITIILSYFTLVFGELVPKKIGLAYSKELSYKMVNIVDFVIKVCKPFILILKNSTDFVTKILKIKKKTNNFEDDLKSTIVDSSLEELEKKLLLNVFEFNDTTVKDIMIKKNDVISIDKKIGKDELLNIIKEYRFTRFPVMDDNKVIGVLNIKDLIVDHNRKFKLKDYIKSIPVINEDMIIDDAFLYLNSNYQAMAIVVGDDGEYLGIVTTTDIIEEIIGNVFDEYDKKSK